MRTKQLTYRWFGLALVLLILATGVPPLLGATSKSSPLFSADDDLQLSAAAANWPYKGMTYVSWTRGDYPWATSW